MKRVVFVAAPIVLLAVLAYWLLDDRRSPTVPVDEALSMPRDIEPQSIQASVHAEPNREIVASDATPEAPHQSKEAVDEFALTEEEANAPAVAIDRWPESKLFRRMVLKKAVQAMRQTAGSAECSRHAQDVMTVSIGTIMDAAGTSAPKSKPWYPRDDQEQYFFMNEREYRPKVGEYWEVDEFAHIINARDAAKGKAPPASGALIGLKVIPSSEISTELAGSLEQRAREALKLLSP